MENKNSESAVNDEPTVEIKQPAILDTKSSPPAPNAPPQVTHNVTNQTVEIDLDKVSEMIAPKSDRYNNINYDNKAFESEDVNTNNQNENPFDRMARPGSMMSIRSTASKTSRSSVNCSNGRVKCPNFRLNKFFSYQQENGFSKASEDVKRLVLPKDGQIIGTWLLVEISYWDLHREKIVLLTDNVLFNISYDFIGMKILEYSRTELNTLKKVRYGNLTYPKGSFMGKYMYGAVKLVWGEEDLSFFQRWSPLAAPAPFIVFTSHHILYNEKEKETSIYNCDEFIASLEYAISKQAPENDPTRTIPFIEQEIEIPSYASLISVLYNHNWMGFNLDRNGINF